MHSLEKIKKLNRILEEKQEANPLEQKTLLTDILVLNKSAVLSYLNPSSLETLAKTNRATRIAVNNFLYSNLTMKKIINTYFPGVENLLTELFPDTEEQNARREEFIIYNMENISKEITLGLKKSNSTIKKEHILLALQKKLDLIVLPPNLRPNIANEIKLKLIEFSCSCFLENSKKNSKESPGKITDHLQRLLALRMAAQYNQAETVKFLISEIEKAYNTQTFNPESNYYYDNKNRIKGEILLAAATGNHKEIVEILLKAETAFSDNVQFFEDDKIRLAVLSANTGKIDLLEVLINDSTPIPLPKRSSANQEKNDGDRLSEIITLLETPPYKNSFTRNLLIALGHKQNAPLSELLLLEDVERTIEDLGSILLYSTYSLKNIELISRIFSLQDLNTMITPYDVVTAFGEFLKNADDSHLVFCNNVFLHYLSINQNRRLFQPEYLISAAATNSNRAVLGWAIEKFNTDLTSEDAKKIILDGMRGKTPDVAIELTEKLFQKVSEKNHFLELLAEVAFQDNVALAKAMLIHLPEKITDELVKKTMEEAVNFGSFYLAQYLIKKNKNLFFQENFYQTLLGIASKKARPLCLRLILNNFSPFDKSVYIAAIKEAKHLLVIKYLLEHPSSPLTPDEKKTAFLSCKKKGYCLAIMEEELAHLMENPLPEPDPQSTNLLKPRPSC